MLHILLHRHMYDFSDYIQQTGTQKEHQNTTLITCFSQGRPLSLSVDESFEGRFCDHFPSSPSGECCSCCSSTQSQASKPDSADHSHRPCTDITVQATTHTQFRPACSHSSIDVTTNATDTQTPFCGICVSHGFL